MTLNTTNLNYLWSSLIIDTLLEFGIDSFYVSPGYRCAPLLDLLYRKRDELFVEVILDERRASYMALGAVKYHKKPAVLICTSGTAGANYYPAIIEAWHSHLPLIVLTADRPFDEWDVDAAQSINQKGLYSHFVVSELNLPHAQSDISLRHLQGKICYTLEQSLLQQRPVHINFPLKSALTPTFEQIDPSYYDDFQKKGPFIGRFLSSQKEELFEGIESLLSSFKRPLVVVGSLENREREPLSLESVKCFLASLKVPFFIDIASSLKHSFPYTTYKNHLISIEDPLSAGFLYKKYRFDGVLHLGGRLVSNNYYRKLSQSGVSEVVVSPWVEQRDPASCVGHYVVSSVSTFCKNYDPTLLGEGGGIGHFAEDIFDLNQTLVQQKRDSVEALLVEEIVSFLEEGDVLILGNSLTVRYFDHYCFFEEAKNIDIVTTRGVSGIEGFVSMSLGFARLSKKRVVLVLGDISFLHDLSALLDVTKEDQLKIIVLNNYKGAIFSTLGLKDYPDSLNPLIESPHAHSIVDLCAPFDLCAKDSFNRVSFSQELKRQLSKDHLGPTLLEYKFYH